MKSKVLTAVFLTVLASGCLHASTTEPAENPVPDTRSIPDNTVIYTGNGFTPRKITVEQGETVTWENRANQPMWVGVDRHPTHTRYDGTSLREHCQNGQSDTFDQCSTGQTYSFTFNKTGEWSYHNHENPSHTGTVIVE